jgi:hypothetical protein
MKAPIAEYLADLRFGELQTFQNMGVVPLFTSRNGGPGYILMNEALERNLIKITEVSTGGSVPNLKVINESDEMVLLLDGEELMGAKQNRTLNASILLAPKSETVIPVSCTEQGRWHYASPDFKSSGHVMAGAARSMRSSWVQEALEQGKGYQSNQLGVWEEISKMHKLAAVESPTEAMSDVYEAKSEDLSSYLDAFPIQPDQKGILAIINGKAVGLDVLSRAPAYGELHAKLVKSYAFDAMVRRIRDVDSTAAEEARIFVVDARECERKEYPSTGVGTDVRLQGEKIIGSMLTCEESVIHLALFRREKREEIGRFASYRARRESRRTEPSEQ